MDMLTKYAKILIEYSNEIKKDQLVLIRSTDLGQPLVRKVYEEVLKVGAFPILRAGLDGISETFYKHASEEQLDRVDPLLKRDYETVDVMISIAAPHNLKNLTNIPPETLARHSKANKVLTDLLMDRSAKKELAWVICNYPTQAQAQQAEMSLDEYTDFVYKACYLYEDDPISMWKNIQKEQDILVNKLNGTKKLHIIGERTDIKLSVDGRIWQNCCGKNNFPDGEIYTSPVEDSAEGYVYFDFPAIYRGSEVQKIYLEFNKGKVVKSDAEKNLDYLNKMISQDEGASYLGEFAIGTNQQIQKITGDILFDEKIGGSIHMALGASYPETGGKNKSGLHWDIIKNMKNGGQIFADDKLIYKNGKFLI